MVSQSILPIGTVLNINEVLRTSKYFMNDNDLG